MQAKNEPLVGFKETKSHRSRELVEGHHDILRQAQPVRATREVAASFARPANEVQRLAALRELGILDTASEIAYDEIAELAAQICGCPVAYINFIDDDRRWLKAKYGLPSAASEAPRATAVCSTTICGTEVLMVPDLQEDSHFRQSPMVVGEPHCRFFLLRHAAHHR